MSAPAGEGLRPLRLLIVEDSPADAELVVAKLKQSGLMVSYELVATPADFQQHLAREYDAILCDHDLHTWIGLEALAMVRNSGKNTPFVVVTGTIGEEAAVEYMRQGASDYVLKDNSERLPLVLERALKLKAKLDENQRLHEAILCAKMDWELTFDTVSDPIMLLDADGFVQRCNKATSDALGIEFDQIVGKSHASLLHCSQECPFSCPFHSMLKTGEHRRCDLSLKVLNRTFDVVAAPMRNNTGAIRGGILVMRDISERLKLDEQFRQAQKMEAVGLLAGGIAHDFNNLLNVISGNAELLEKRGLQTPGHELGEITGAVRRAARLTSQLLAFSRRQVLQPRPLDLNTVIAEVEKMLVRLIGEDIAVVTELEPELGYVRADPGQLEEVLMNLATNARDAMPDGGTFTIRTRSMVLTEDDRADHPYIKPGPHVLLSVLDTGHGMSPGVCERIFEPFFTTKEQGHGSGLGLAVVYGVVKQSGGYIWCASEVGKGTRFDICLPKVSGVTATSEVTREMPASEAHGTETIMILEDEDALLRILSEFLTQCGYSVLPANTPHRALELARDHSESISLGIMDTILPEMNGPAAAAELKRVHPEMQFLFISGYIDRPILDKLIKDHVPFLQKPIAKATLVTKVHELLHLRRMQKPRSTSSKPLNAH